MNGDNLVEPRDPMAAPAAETEAAPADTGADLPDEVLQVPALQGVFAGNPPAVSAQVEAFQKLPEAQVIVKNKDALSAAGMGFYRSLAGDIGVLFNRLYVQPEEIQAADKAGKLLEIAPPFEQVNQQIAGAGAEHPALKHDGNVPTAFKSVAPPAVAQPAAPPAPAGVQKKIATARVNASAQQSPTSGPRPGGGRILNAVLKQPV